MNKEKIFALVLGTIVGLGMGLFVMLSNRQTSRVETKDIEQKIFNNQKLSGTTETVAESVDIVVNNKNVNNKIISQKQTYNLKLTLPVDGLLVVVSNYDRQVAFVKSGEFDIDINLTPAENTVKVVLYTLNNTFSVLQKDLKIYYFPEKL
ncbi:MAG: hypothetical protein KatS3mg091_773 [Patescibacteria group bacterium]|nr:MAG: hypothetical protein KatS3mg091_773 [Patescibacteria group bacterium]